MLLYLHNEGNNIEYAGEAGNDDRLQVQNTFLRTTFIACCSGSYLTMKRSLKKEQPTS